MDLLGVWGYLGLLHLAEYCLVMSVIVTSTAVTLHLIRKRRTIARRDVGPPLSRRQLGGLIAIITIFWASLLSINLYTDRTMEPWTFEEWASGNLHILFLAVLCLILLLGSFGVVAKNNKKTRAPRSTTKPEPHTIGGGKGSRSDRARLLVIVLALAIILIIWVIPFPFAQTYNETYLERTPYNVTRTYNVREPYIHNKTLESPLQISPGGQFLDNHPIHTPPEGTVHIQCDIHLEAYNNTLEGVIKDGGGMDFYIFSNTEYSAWSQGQESQPLICIRHVENCEFGFIPNQSETYHLVLDNRLSPLNKTANLTLIHSWAEEVTGSQYVTRTRNITEYNETLRTHKLTKREWTTLAKRWFR